VEQEMFLSSDTQGHAGLLVRCKCSYTHKLTCTKY